MKSKTPQKESLKKHAKDTKEYKTPERGQKGPPVDEYYEDELK